MSSMASADANSGLKVEIVSEPDLGTGLPLNEVKPGDYIRIDYKGYVGGFGKEMIDSSEKSGPMQLQVGVGAKEGIAGIKSKTIYKLPVLAGVDQACLGKKMGTRLRIEIPAALAFGPNGGETGTGTKVPPGTTVFYEVRLRSRVFSGLLDKPQENFLEIDQVAKFNKLLGIE